MEGLPTVTCGPPAAPAGRPLTSRPVRAVAKPRRRAVVDGTAAPKAVDVLPLSPRSSCFLLPSGNRRRRGAPHVVHRPVPVVRRDDEGQQEREEDRRPEADVVTE